MKVRLDLMLDEHGNPVRCRWCGSDLLNDFEVESKLCEPCMDDFEDSLADDYDDDEFDEEY